MVVTTTGTGTGTGAGNRRAVSVGAVLVDAAAPVDVRRDVHRDVPAAARYAESVGLDSLWAGDHLAMGSVPLLDCTLVLAAAAAATARVLLGTAVFVPSLRPPVWAAKQIATLIVLAGERPLQLGVAVGAGQDEEFRAAGFVRGDRARRTDEFLQALPALLSGDRIALPGPDGPVEVQLAPPVPPPVLWLGGTSPTALRRAVRFGDGWLAGLVTVEQFAAVARQLAEFAERGGRTRPRLGVVAHAAIGDARDRGTHRTATSVLARRTG